MTYGQFATDVPEGAQVLIDDGELGLRVEYKEGNALLCRVENDATLG